MKSLIVGFGEIGKGIFGAVKDSSVFETYDTKEGDVAIVEDIALLHICIPGNLPDFKEQVVKYIKQFHPQVATIVHSTVIPNTCREIAVLADEPVFHCPIRGKHPDMARHIRVYALHIGCDNFEVGEKVLKIFTKTYGLQASLVNGTTTTELGKILELYRYGLLVYSAYLQTQACDYYDVPYENAVNDFIYTYNHGLDAVDMKQYKQATIPEKRDEFIGGHCVVENCWELYKDLKPDVYLKYMLGAVSLFGKGERDLK